MTKSGFVLAVGAIFGLAGVASADVISFQQGLAFSDGSTYSGTTNSYIADSSPNTTRGTSSEFYLSSSNPNEEGLLAFNNIFGSGPNQIPVGSTITSATLTLVTTNGGASTRVYQLLTPFNESTVTFNTFASTPGGVAGIDYVSTPIASVSTPAVGAAYSFDLTSVVSAWSNGTDNDGLMLLASSTNAIHYNSDRADQSLRPMLTVTFTPATVPEPASIGALMVGAGALLMRRKSR